MLNISKTKLVQIGLKSLCDRWPMIKTWSNLPNDMLLEIGLAVIESEESWGEMVYLPKKISKIIDEYLGYDKNLYYTRVGRGYVYDDGFHAQYGELESIMTID